MTFDAVFTYRNKKRSATKLQREASFAPIAFEYSQIFGTCHLNDKARKAANF